LKPLLADCLHALAVAVGYDNSSSGSGGGSGGRAGAAAAPAMLGGGGGGGEAQQSFAGGPGGAASAASAAAHITPTAALLEANMFFFLRTWFLQRPEDPEALLRCLPWELCGEASVSAFARRHAAIIHHRSAATCAPACCAPARSAVCRCASPCLRALWLCRYRRQRQRHHQHKHRGFLCRCRRFAPFFAVRVTILTSPVTQRARTKHSTGAHAGLTVS